MRIALTFDDGPSQWTEPILDILAEHDARATFFLVGANINGRERTLWRALADGHEFGNHTFNHHRMTGLSNVDAWHELERTNDLIADLTGRDITIWRAPHLDLDVRVATLANMVGLSHVGVTVDPADWQSPADRIVADVTRQAHDEAVVLLHDGTPPDGGSGSKTREATVQALPQILEQLPGRYVTLSELSAVAA